MFEKMFEKAPKEKKVNNGLLFDRDALCLKNVMSYKCS